MVYNKYVFILFFCFVSGKVLAQELSDQDTLKAINKNAFNKFLYPDGSVQSEGFFKNGKPVGIWKNYYANGKLKSVGKKLAGLSDSTWTFYYPNGALQAQLLYTKGKKNGLSKFYYETEALKSDELFANNQKEGLSRYYYLNGQVLRDTWFKQNLEQGYSKEFDENGVLKKIFLFREGFIQKEEVVNVLDANNVKQGHWVEFFPNSQQLKFEGFYKDGLKNGLFNTYDISGKVLTEEKFINDIPEAEFKKNSKNQKQSMALQLKAKRDYFANGQVRAFYALKNGKKEGRYREFDSSGAIVKNELYKNGKLSGLGNFDSLGLEQGYWTYYFPNGKVKSMGTYLNGKKAGVWKFYFDNGKLAQQGNFINGEPDGIWKIYYQSGNLLANEVYVSGLLEGGYTELADDSSGNKITAKGNYFRNMRDGDWIYYVGDVTIKGKYQNDNEIGVWEEIYNNGNLCFSGNYENGVENGIHKYYYENGKLKEERFYKSGLRQGDWKIYNEKAKLIVTITYKDDKEIKINGDQIALKNLKRGRTAVKNKKKEVEKK